MARATTRASSPTRPPPSSRPNWSRIRLVRYANLLGKENIVASVDCGVGGRCYPEIGWAKLKSLVEGARLASQQLWG